MPRSEWFKEWFDSPFYHVLYAHRDLNESIQFIDALLSVLDPKPDARIMDLACGKGRHARYLASKGYITTGVDLSTESIEFARQYENQNLSFYQHDMRQPFRYNYFDYIFNFFTSFGYFETAREHVSTLINIRKGLVQKGTFIIDFLNVEKVIENIPRSETILRNGMVFDIKVKYQEKKIIKQITINTEDGETLSYEERVWGFTLKDFETMFTKAGLEIKRTFGNYEMETYKEKSSDRLIIEAVNNG